MNLSLLSRYAFFACIALFTLLSLPFLGSTEWLWPFTLLGVALSLLGLFDLIQTPHAVRRNYPILGNIRKASARRSASTCWKPTATPCPSPAPSARWSTRGRRTKARRSPSAP